MSYRELDGKLAIITGGSRGIGAATARNLASKGASLVLNYTSDSSSEKTASFASELEKAHDIKAVAVQADMGDPQAGLHLVNTAKNHFSHPKTGKFQIDIVINNAGVSSNEPLNKVKVESFHRLYAVNVLGPLLLMQAAMPYLPQDKSGRIVNISSVSATIGPEGQSVYGGTKAALDAMTRTWARELRDHCTVNAVNPGPVATDMYAGVPGSDFEKQIKPWVDHAPLAEVKEGRDPKELVEYAKAAGGRPAFDHEVAGIVGMLCTRDAAWCTGSVVCANGGMVFGLT